MSFMRALRFRPTPIALVCCPQRVFEPSCILQPFDAEVVAVASEASRVPLA